MFAYLMIEFSLGPTGLPIVGNIGMFIKHAEDGVSLMRMLHKQYGDIVKLSGHYSLGPGVFMLFRLDHIKELFITQADYFSKRPTSMWLINELFKKKGKESHFTLQAGIVSSQ